MLKTLDCCRPVTMPWLFTLGRLLERLGKVGKVRQGQDPKRMTGC